MIPMWTCDGCDRIFTTKEDWFEHECQDSLHEEIPTMTEEQQQNDTLKALIAGMDTSPKNLTIPISVVCPSAQLNGSWLAATTIAGIRVIGLPSTTATAALRNLLAKLSNTGSYQDPEATLAMELALAPPETLKALEQ